MIRTFKYRLYRGKKTTALHQRIDVAGIIWNHCVALQRRYWRLTGKYISRYLLQKHIAKLKKRPKYSFWGVLDAQAIQEIVERLDNSYQRFFAYKAGKTSQKSGRPKFRKVKTYKSFTFKQTGWKLLGGNQIRLQGTVYKFAKSREIEGVIKTVTVKRDELDNLWLCFACEDGFTPMPVTPSHIVGMDFGLRTFLKLSDGTAIDSPQFFKQGAKEIRRLNRSLSRKKDGSRNRREAKNALNRAHARIANRRRDWFFRLAHDLTDHFDVIVIEDLNIKSMQQIWGRKVSDLSFTTFVTILEHVARRKGKVLHKVDRFFASSKTCSSCGTVNQSLELSDRKWVCRECGVIHDRDHNAALNLEREGASSLGLGDVRPASAGYLCLSPESHAL